jgi:hypothetical protein
MQLSSAVHLGLFAASRAMAVAIPLSDNIIIDVVRIGFALHSDSHPSTFGDITEKQV